MSVMGEWVDMSLEDFKKKLVDEKTPVGVISSLIVVFESTYWNLNRKGDISSEGDSFWIINNLLSGYRVERDGWN